MYRRASNAGAVVVAVLLSLVAGVALGLPTDRNQAIEVAADRAVRDDRAGFTEYSGDVILTQGSLHIEADRLRIYHTREAADRIIAEGNPARLRQRPALDEALVHASAQRIVYIKSLERIVLRETAQIEQDGAVVSGDSIEYFMAERRVRADAREDEGSDRVQVIIPPEIFEEPPPEDGEGEG